MNDHQLDNRLNLLAICAALAFVVTGAIEGMTAHDASAYTAPIAAAPTPPAEVELPRIVVHARRETQQTAWLTPTATICAERVPLSMETVAGLRSLN